MDPKCFEPANDKTNEWTALAPLSLSPESPNKWNERSFIGHSAVRAVCSLPPGSAVGRMALHGHSGKRLRAMAVWMPETSGFQALSQRESRTGEDLGCPLVQ
jgi:hypothetical protein